MDKLIEGIGELFLSRGIEGAIILVLGFAVYKLYNRNQELHDTLSEIGRESVRVHAQMVASLDKIVDALRLRGKV